jgi:hypothetical protein
LPGIWLDELKKDMKIVEARASRMHVWIGLSDHYELYKTRYHMLFETTDDKAMFLFYARTWMCTKTAEVFILLQNIFLGLKYEI